MNLKEISWKEVLKDIRRIKDIGILLTRRAYTQNI